LTQVRSKLESLHDEHAVDREKAFQDQKAEIERKTKQIESRSQLLEVMIVYDVINEAKYLHLLLIH